MQATPSFAQVIDRILPRSTAQRVLLALLGGAILTGAAAMPLLSTLSHSPESPQPVQPTIASVTALGRLEPQGEVVKLAPTAPGSRLAQLFVQQGDQVKAGQIIAVLDSHERLQAALLQAKQQVTVAQTKLAQVKAGAKTGEIDAQKAAVNRTAAQLQQDVQAKAANVARLEAEVQNAQLEYQRHEALYQTGAVSASLRDSKQLILETAQQQLNEAKANRDQAAATLSAQLNEAKATLNSVAEVRPVDVAAAQAEVDSALAAVQRAQAELDLATVRSPRDGQILKIYTWPGEIVGDDGIAELGQTQQMNVIAEVYETDVQRLKLGQTAQITSAAFTGTLTGTIQQIGLQVLRKGIRDTNPTADADGRIIEVKIQLDKNSTTKVAGLTNLEVTVEVPLN